MFACPSWNYQSVAKERNVFRCWPPYIQVQRCFKSPWYFCIEFPSSLTIYFKYCRCHEHSQEVPENFFSSYINEIYPFLDLGTLGLLVNLCHWWLPDMWFLACAPLGKPASVTHCITHALWLNPFLVASLFRLSGLRFSLVKSSTICFSRGVLRKAVEEK